VVMTDPARARELVERLQGGSDDWQTSWALRLEAAAFIESTLAPEEGVVPVAQFKPCIQINEELGITEIIFEDTGYVATPVFDGVHHWIDKHEAMDDGRLVGMTVWLTKPPHPLRNAPCPRPMNDRPADETAGSCFDAKCCGCVYGAALAGDTDA
jgi:hypothetical protein